jgi:hypothetical protein
LGGSFSSSAAWRWRANARTMGDEENIDKRTAPCCISREDWEFDGADMVKRTLSEREGAGEATEVWDYRWRRSVRKYLNIRQCQLAPLCSLQPLQRAIAVQQPSRPKIPHSSINVNNIKWELTLIWY